MPIAISAAWLVIIPASRPARSVRRGSERGRLRPRGGRQIARPASSRRLIALIAEPEKLWPHSSSVITFTPAFARAGSSASTPPARTFPLAPAPTPALSDESPRIKSGVGREPSGAVCGTHTRRRRILCPRRPVARQGRQTRSKHCHRTPGGSLFRTSVASGGVVSDNERPIRTGPPLWSIRPIIF